MKKMREKDLPKKIHITKGLRVRIANKLLVRLNGQRLRQRGREVDIREGKGGINLIKKAGAHTYLRIL